VNIGIRATGRGGALQLEFVEVGELRLLVANLLPDVEGPEDLLSKIVEAVSQPEIPPDVAEVRIMSLHKSKGLSSPVVVIAGCVNGLLPSEPDRGTPAAQRQATLEEQRRRIRRLIGLEPSF
jgi:ATP-dependent DNA helicase UvrD/PcrA